MRTALRMDYHESENTAFVLQTSFMLTSCQRRQSLRTAIPTTRTCPMSYSMLFLLKPVADCSSVGSVEPIVDCVVSHISRAEQSLKTSYAPNECPCCQHEISDLIVICTAHSTLHISCNSSRYRNPSIDARLKYGSEWKGSSEATIAWIRASSHSHGTSGSCSDAHSCQCLMIFPFNLGKSL